MDVCTEIVLVEKSSRPLVLGVWLDPGVFMLLDVKLFICVMTWADGCDVDRFLSSSFIDASCSGK